jgi:MFS family permease
MIPVIRSTWALLLGVMLLMVGNGLQGTLLGVRGGIEGFSTLAMSVVMSGYFAGFLLGSRMAPEMIRRVGHVRVFAALGSFISAGLILFPVLTDPVSWTVLRFLIGFCFCGVYITSESWLNNATSNETRGQALSLYLIVQMVGIVLAQVVFAFGDAGGWVLFILPSVLVSIAFAPILLTISPVPPFDTTAPMTFREIYKVSPLGCVGIFLLGGMFSALFGMSAVYASAVGLSTTQIATFVGAIYTGGMVMQYPIGWLSDRMDRRQLIFWGAVVGTLGSLPALLGLGGFTTLLVVAFVIGGMANPLYALLLAYTNDYLKPEDMASASARLLFINGLGAIAGPLITGWLMEVAGPRGFFLYITVLLGALAAYAAYRMTQRPALVAGDDYDAVSMQAVSPASTAVAMEAMIENWEDEAAENAEAGAEERAL